MSNEIDKFDDLERLVEAQAAAWAKTPAPRALDADEERIAAKLLGSSTEAKRLAETKTGERFRYQRQETTKIEFFYIPDGPGSRHHRVGCHGWQIDVYINRRKRQRPFAYGLNDDQCLMALEVLRNAKYDPRLVVTPAMRTENILEGPIAGRAIWDYGPFQVKRRPPAKPRQGRSKRFAMLDHLRDFRR